jgi:hypothetical protein
MLGGVKVLPGGRRPDIDPPAEITTGNAPAIL